MSALKVIGRGHFTTAYRKDRKTVILKSRDKAKECMSLGWFPSSNLFPTVTRISGQDENGFSMYEMKYVTRVRSPKKQLTKEHYELYKTLKTVYSMRLDNADDIIRKFEALPIKRSIKNHLIDAVSALTNYGSDVHFEISPRNIGVTKTGKLILMDCFFFVNDLRH